MSASRLLGMRVELQGQPVLLGTHSAAEIIAMYNLPPDTVESLTKLAPANNAMGPFCQETWSSNPKTALVVPPTVPEVRKSVEWMLRRRGQAPFFHWLATEFVPAIRPLVRDLYRVASLACSSGLGTHAEVDRDVAAMFKEAHSLCRPMAKLVTTDGVHTVKDRKLLTSQASSIAAFDAVLAHRQEEPSTQIWEDFYACIVDMAAVVRSSVLPARDDLPYELNRLFGVAEGLLLALSAVDRLHDETLRLTGAIEALARARGLPADSAGLLLQQSLSGRERLTPD